ncbi:hypothetical protein BJ138DRAFT_1126362 [Hygrophoropsis aurantiaca]|uniref:Uncharacterized protein n=1 Tax=Hygrophoropsis aurantiaca TaxID=72124 RepID=A0ACB8ACN2_9AGAM|nr:hypothetical protein BJ138DRAFT_1126362 [Hygrophoropsis aurantiaca]
MAQKEPILTLIQAPPSNPRSPSQSLVSIASPRSQLVQPVYGHHLTQRQDSNLGRTFYQTTSQEPAIVASSVSPPPHRSTSPNEIICASGSSTSPQHTLDLPSWTSLSVQSESEEEDEIVDGLVLGEDHMVTLTAPSSKPRQMRTIITPATSTATTTPLAASSSASRTVRNGKLIFDGVVISSRPPISAAPISVKNTISETRVAPTSDLGGKPQNALTAALQQAFSQNKRPLSPSPRKTDTVSVGRKPRGHGETAPIDAGRYPPPKRRKTQHQLEHVPSESWSSSADQTPVPDELLAEAKRPRRVNPSGLKESVIAYDAHRAVVDAALETRVATVTWSEGDNHNDRWHGWSATRREYPIEGLTMQFNRTARVDDVNSTHAQVDTAEGETAAQPVLPGRLARLHARHAGGYTAPRKSTAESFQDRYETFFGTIPLPDDVSFKLSDPILLVETSSNQDESEVVIPRIRRSPSGTPESTDSAGAEVSTAATSEPPEPESHSLDEEKVVEWTAALQKLVKGKTMINEEGLDNLSIVLGEIESVQSGIDKDTLVATGLDETLKQLSVLSEIPYGDVYRLRERALRISGGWSSL